VISRQAAKAINSVSTMTDAYAVLGLPDDSNDEAIRRRYLELVRQYSPERDPERFAAVRRAYETLRDLDTRLRHRLFEAGRSESIDALIEEMACRTPRRRLGLAALLTVLPKL
jgi:curved DNA-binding protein CbpA